MSPVFCRPFAIPQPADSASQHSNHFRPAVSPDADTRKCPRPAVNRTLAPVDTPRTAGCPFLSGSIASPAEYRPPLHRNAPINAPHVTGISPAIHHSATGRFHPTIPGHTTPPPPPPDRQTARPADSPTDDPTGFRTAASIRPVRRFSVEFRPQVRVSGSRQPPTIRKGPPRPERPFYLYVLRSDYLMITARLAF